MLCVNSEITFPRVQPLISPSIVWPTWRKISFRFAFIYLALYTAPWNLLGSIPGTQYVLKYYDQGWDWVVRWANGLIFHVADPLVPMAGSGDTSFGWAQLWFTLSIAALGAITWSAIDRKRPHYEVLDYWLRIVVRYYIAYYCFTYGLIKVFALQMPFPNTSQLATPLGDFLPMRLSWMFIGYSSPYQVFSGFMETLAGILLIPRRTVTLGLLASIGVFINVVVLNLAYDIPVKLFSAHLLLFCLFLLSYDTRRLFNFFVLNKPTPPSHLYELEFSKPWQRYTHIIAKGAFVVIAALLPTYENLEYYRMVNHRPETKPIRSGLYDVELFVWNQSDTVPALVTDSLRWQDMVFEKDGGGSVKTLDPLFRQRYRRGYFGYKADTTRNILELRYFPQDSLPILSMAYKIAQDESIELRTKVKEDSLYVRLKKSKRHFQLAERQFHWLSEANR